MVNLLSKFISPAVFEWDQAMNAAAADAGIGEAANASGIPGAANPLGSPSHTAFAQQFAARYPRPTATIDDVVAHCEQIRAVAGIEHMGIGADYDGGDPFPVGLRDVSTYPRLLDALAARGWSSDDLDKLGHRNVIRVLREIEDAAG